MKIIHCADLHLDSKMTSNLDREKARETKNELLLTYKRMIDYANKEGITDIIFAGDLFDTKNVSKTAMYTVRDSILNNPHINFYYLKGNHDAICFVDELEEKIENLYLFSDMWTSYEISDNVSITGVELLESNKDSIYNTLVLDNNKINIVVLHGQETEHNMKDKAEIISLKNLRNKGIDYLALGHVHEYMMERLDARGIYAYPGCLEGRGFDECGEHGFIVLDIDEDKKNINAEFIPFAYRLIHTVKIDVTDVKSTDKVNESAVKDNVNDNNKDNYNHQVTTDDVSKKIRQRLEEDYYDEKDLMKIVLTGEVDFESEINTGLLVKEFESSFYFLKIYDETKMKVDYDSFALDESLKGEFVRLVMSKKDLSEEEKAIIVRYGIKALTMEEIE